MQAIDVVQCKPQRLDKRPERDLHATRARSGWIKCGVPWVCPRDDSNDVGEDGSSIRCLDVQKAANQLELLLAHFLVKVEVEAI